MKTSHIADNVNYSQIEELAAAKTILISKPYLVFSTCSLLCVVDINSRIQGARLCYPYPHAIAPDYNTILSETNHVFSAEPGMQEFVLCKETIEENIRTKKVFHSGFKAIF